MGDADSKASMPAAADMRSILAVTGCETASAEIAACSCTDMRKDGAARATAGTFAPPPYALVLPRKSWLSVAWPLLCSVHRVNMAGDGLGKHIDENGPYYRLKLCINDINDIGPYGYVVGCGVSPVSRLI